MPAPTTYDPTCEQEQIVPLPSAPAVPISDILTLQPPLSRRGTGPGLFIILPPSDQITPSTKATKTLDPPPVMKWAEEGFAVVSAVSSDIIDVDKTIEQALDALDACPEVDIKSKFAIIVYDQSKISTFSEASKHPRVRALIGYTSESHETSTFPLPALLHIATTSTESPPKAPTSGNTVEQHVYQTPSTHFVLPMAAEYNTNLAALAHSRTLVFLRTQLGGPFFDLNAIWEEHCYFEFEARSVARTMGTMVAEPCVNDVPVMTGGIGREALTNFYRDHFIFVNPADARMEPISRTIGHDRIVDEFIFHATHDRVIDWMLPGIPPTGKKFAVPAIAVVNVRGDRLYNEHIWWDQATALRQIGILPDTLPFVDPQNPTAPPKLLRIPVAGAECAEMLLDESNGTSNEMLGPKYGIQN